MMEKFRLVFVVVIAFVLLSKTCEAQSYLINCGSNSSVILNGRRWVGDSSPNSNITLSSIGTPVSTDAGSVKDSMYGELYRTARLFESSLNYSFQGVVKGDYFVRLHFSPFLFDSHNVNESSFGVLANGMRLVEKYVVPGEIAQKNTYLLSSGGNLTSSLVKEYVLAINRDALVIEFIPDKGRFGFVNAIEIVAATEELFAGSASKVGGNGANVDRTWQGIETMYRLNVGGSEVSPSQDSGLWRRWEVDTSYMITANAGLEISNSSNITYSSVNDTSVAPLLVYESARTMSNNEVLEKRFNMSWKFEVDPEFDYLIRLHFCELVFDKANQRIFRVYINNRTAADNFNVFVRAGGMNKAYHQDFFDVVSSKVKTLWIQLGPDTAVGAAGTDALLNGLEIFKISRNGNLAFVDSYDMAASSSKASSKNAILWATIGAGAASVIILAAIVYYLCKRRSKKLSDTKGNPPGWRPLFLVNSTVNAKGSGGSKSQQGSVAANRTGKRFLLTELRAATNNFNESLVIGVGGFGKVYKGEIEDGTLVAIKRSNPQSQQGLAEFETEIEMLSKLRHRHLVSLIGFCDEQNEMILVYEYMANGTLRSHLFGSEFPPLTWKQRVEVCIGAARGLHYLHTGADRGVIHRDVKTTNILLDEDFVAKMSDFGLSKAGPALDHTHVSTAVKGSFGYLDPEYFRRQQLTEKSDVYSFGVVLFEAVCSRPVINPTLPKDQINLAEWAMKWQRQRSLETIIDPRLEGSYCPESMKKFGDIAEKCLADEGKSRPTMGEVLWHLEYVLQLHVAWLRKNAGEHSITRGQGFAGLALDEAEEREAISFDEESGCSRESTSKGLNDSTTTEGVV